MSPVKLCMLAGLMSAMSAQASVIPYPSSTGGSVADNSTSTFSFDITDNFNITDLDLQLNLSHTFVGDLSIVLTGPGSTSVTLMNRPGVPASALGYSANLSADKPIIFDDEGSVSAEQMGSQCGTTNAVVGVDCNVGTHFIPTDFLSLFDGMSTQGTWSLAITDSATGDTGNLRSFSLLVSTDSITVPEPESLALLGLGLIGMFAARRKSMA